MAKSLNGEICGDLYAFKQHDFLYIRGL